MRQDQAVALLLHRFPGAVETVDTSSPGAGVTVDPLGQCWRDRCPCPRHAGPASTTTGHAAKPIQRPRSAR